MSINLQKDRVDLTKGNAGLTRLMVGLGDGLKIKKEVFCKAFLVLRLVKIDCDVSVYA